MEKRAVKFTTEQIKALKRIAKENKLKGAGILDEYTDEEMAESFNGAGGSDTPEWQRWLLTKIMEKKLPAILIHDMAYRKGGSESDFKRVNSELQENLSSMYDNGGSTWWNYVGRKAKELTDSRGGNSWGKA